MTVGPGWNGVYNQGSDIAIIDLGELAPLVGDLRETYRGGAEVGRVVDFFGYGNTNRIDPRTGAVLDAGGGVTTTAFGTKRVGTNRIDSIAGGSFPFFDRPKDTLRIDLDTPGSVSFPAVTGEAICAPGDSGGPMLLFNQIAGVCPGGSLPIGFFGTADYTRVSPFAGWIDNTVGGPRELVVDLSHQLSGDDRDIDSVALKRNGGFLALFVNGRSRHRDSLSGVSSVTVRGSGDGDNLAVAPDLGKQVTFGGGGGSNPLLVSSVSASTSVDIINGLVGVQTGGWNSLIRASNVPRITATGDARDAVRLLAVRADSPVSVVGVGTATVPTFGAVNGPVSVFGRGVTNLTITDTSESSSTFWVLSGSIDASGGGRIATSTTRNFAR